MPRKPVLHRYFVRIDKYVLLSVVLGAATFCCALFGTNTLCRGQSPEASPVRVAVVQRHNLASSQSFVGTVHPVRTSIVGSPVDGRVDEFVVNAGDRVKAGDMLCQLRTKALEIDIAGAQAELELKRQLLAELQHGSLPEEITEAKARLDEMQASLGSARSRRRRLESLLGTPGIITDEEREDSQALLDRTEATVAVAQANYEKIKAGPRQEKILQAQAEVAIAREAVHRLQDQLERHTIVAPFDGYVVEEHTEVGQWIAKSSPIAKVVEVSSMEIEAVVLETYIPMLHLGMTAKVALSAYPEREFRGPVISIVPQADVRTRGFPVRIRLQNEETKDGPLFKSGMFARVHLNVGSPRLAMVVPKDALVLGKDVPVVYIVDQQNVVSKQGESRSVRKVSVTTGSAVQSWIEVSGDLSVGDLVVVEGNERLTPTSKVRVLQTVEGIAAHIP